MTMDQDGHQGPDGFESPESEDGWYFDLPSGAWERQEEKNRELRERIRGNITQNATHEPFRGRRARPEEDTRGGLAGWAARHMDDPEPESQPSEPAPTARRDDDAPLAAWAGDGWDDPEADPLWQDEPAVPAPVTASLTPGDPFAESGDDFGDPELINAMRAWANQHDAPEAPEASAEQPVTDVAETEAALEPDDMASAMRAWATAAPEAPSAEAGPEMHPRRGEYQSSWRREKPASSEPSRWQEAFEGAPRGENMLDSMRAWADNGPVLPPDEQEAAAPTEIPEEFLKPFDWELDEAAAATVAIFPARSQAAEASVPPAETTPSVAEPALANWDTPLASAAGDGELTPEDEAEAGAPFAWPPAAPVEDPIPPHATIPGFDDEDEIFARARAMASAESHQKPAHEKKGGFMSRLFGKKKPAEPATDIGPGEWVSAEVLDETDTPAWSMAGMAGGPPAAASSLDDWEPVAPPAAPAPHAEAPDVEEAPDESDWAAKARATWASLDDANPPLAAVPAFEAPAAAFAESPARGEEAPEEDDWAAKARATWAALDVTETPPVTASAPETLAWEPLPEQESESAGESSTPAAFAWEWPRIDAAMESDSASPEHAVPTDDPGNENDFTWDPEEFEAEPAVVEQPAARQEAPTWEPETPAFDEPAALIPEPAFEAVPAEEPASREPVPLFPSVAEPESAPAPVSFSFEPEAPADDADPWAAFLSSREQERSAADEPREAARILPFDEPRLTDETTVSMVEPAALAAEPESAGAPAGATNHIDEDRGWDAIASAVDTAEDGDDDWNPEAFATATPVTAPGPEPVAPPPPAFAWDDEDAEPEAAPEPVDIRAWGRTPAPVASESFAPPAGSDWESAEPGATEGEPPADDPWAAVAAASGFESDSPQGIAVYRGHAEHLAQHHDAWDDDEAAPDEDVVLRAFERHAASASRDEDPEAAMPPLPLEPLLGKEGVDVVDEVSPDETASHHGFSRLSGWAPQRTGDEHPVRQPLPRAGRSDPDEEWGFEDDQAIPPWARPPVAEGSPFDGPHEVAPRRRRTLIREIVETGLLAALVFLSVRASFQNFKVDGTSMFPTLENGQFLIVNKLVYSEVDVEKLSRFVPFVHPGDDPRRNVFHGPERGDIIVLEHPAQPGTDLIKRVVGLPGETLEIVDGHVYINDRLLEEPYAPVHWGGTKPRIVIPAGEYYVMGDNRDNSADSRTLGTIPEELIIGKAMVSYWPSNKFGLAPNASPDLTDQKPRLTAQRLGD
ncbi:MAG: signal peptidase I [Dehalococcoidia bacterium]